MNRLTWNDGFSVGIKNIDDEHKQIFVILEQVNEAIINGSSFSVMENVFSRLDNYISIHFSNEEDLMGKIDFHKLEFHKEQHQYFIETILDFKSKVLSDNSQGVAENISSFLYDWLIHHILNDDMDYAQKVFEYNEKNKTTKPGAWNKKLSKWLSSRLKFSIRLMVTTMIPVVGMFLLSFIVLNDDYQKYNNMKSLTGLYKVVFDINTLTHSVQLERGLSNGLVSSEHKKFKQALIKRRTLTDVSIQDLFHQLNKQTGAIKKVILLKNIKSFKQNLGSLKNIRGRIDKKQADLYLVNKIYNRLVAQLLLIANNLVCIDLDSKFTNNINTISAMFRLKEASGQLRAIGTTLIHTEQREVENSQKVTLLFGQQLGEIKSFALSATESQKNIFRNLSDEVFYKNQSPDDFIQVFSRQLKTMNSEEWFDFMTQKIDTLKNVIDSMIADLDQKINYRIHEQKIEFQVIIVLLCLVFALTLFLSLILNQSILSPIRKVTNALDSITSGDKTIQFFDKFASDEIYILFQSYEKLRRCLLQKYIIKDIVAKQKHLLKRKEIQKDNYKTLASTDPLTGAFNRRQFDSFLEQEISNSNQLSRRLSIMSMDIDSFKRINDTYGHSAGDEVLKTFYQACEQNVRSTDIIARIGGEEFVILLPGTKLKHAHHFADRLREKISELKIVFQKQTISLTVSIGVSQWDADFFASAGAFLDHADQALYKAKNDGRNRVVARDIENKEFL